MSKPFVLVHGYTCDRTDWESQVAQLSKNHEVFTPDLRGHGANPGAAADCSIEHYGADVAALLVENGLSDAVLVGHSMGCRVVLQACLEAPSRVAAVALIDGSFRGATGDAAEAARATRAAIDAEGYDNFARRLIAEMFLAPGKASEAAIARGLRLGAQRGTALYASITRWDTLHMERALAAVRVPLLVVQSTVVVPGRGRVPYKPGIDAPWLDLVRRNAPRARIEIIPDVGHFTQSEAPEEVNKLLSTLV